MSVASRLDPRTKIAAWFAMTVTYLLLPAGTLRWGWLVALGVVAVAVGSGRALVRFLMNVILPTAVMLVVIHGVLIAPEGVREASGRVWQVVRPEGVVHGLEVAARLAAIGGGTIVLLSTAPPMELAQGLRSLGAPTSFVTMLLSSLGLIGVTQDRIRRIALAQRSRGLCANGFLVGRARAFVPILRPLFFGLITDALERSALWTSRPYGTAATAVPLRMGWVDVMVCLASAALICGGGVLCLNSAH